MRLLICAGGTGGGVYPALAVLSMMKNEAEVLWVGGEGGMEADLVTRAGVPFTAIPAAGVHGVGLRSLPRNLWQLGRGVAAARRVLASFKPQVLFFTGGYVAAPLAVAGWRIPSLLYVPDLEPGLALRFLSRFARTIALTAPESRRFFKSRARLEVTGYPTRPELQSWQRAAGRKALSLEDDLPVLLVTGGSKGARTLNLALLPLLPRLLQHCQIVHISGSPDWEAVQQARAALSPQQQARYHIYSYLHEMGAALAAADLAVTRAGASTLGEYPLFGLPAIVVPYQYAWRYQQVNAEYLRDHGAALILQASQLEGNLESTITGLLGSPERLRSMQQAMRSLARPDAARKIASLLTELGGAHQQEGK